MDGVVKGPSAVAGRSPRVDIEVLAALDGEWRLYLTGGSSTFLNFSCGLGGKGCIDKSVLPRVAPEESILSSSTRTYVFNENLR